MDTMQAQERKTSRAGRGSAALIGVGAAGLVLGILLGVTVLTGESSQPDASDPAQVVASVVDDLNTAYVYGDMAAIDEIFGDDLVFNPGQGADLVGAAGADFFKENAGTGAVARRVTEPTASSDGTYLFVMEVLPPNQLQPFVFENHATVSDGRVVRIEQGDRILPEDQGGQG